MKKTFLIIALAFSFALGFAFNSLIKPAPAAELKRVTGIGGIFFKCKDAAKLRDWYKTHLGLVTNPYGSVFEWRQAADSTKKGFLMWGTFGEKTKYFLPSTKDYMINYRVQDLTALVEQLKKEGITPTDSMEVVEYGKFIHIMDPEGNKIELWEPNDVEYNKISKETTK